MIYTRHDLRLMLRHNIQNLQIDAKSFKSLKNSCFLCNIINIKIIVESSVNPFRRIYFIIKLLKYVLRFEAYLTGLAQVLKS